MRPTRMGGTGAADGRKAPRAREPLAGLLAALLLTVACAPAVRPVEGPVGDAVQASLHSGTASFDHTAWDRLLREGTRDGLVDYDYFAAGRGDLDAYLERVGAAPLATLAAGELEALMANAYNAITIRSILDHPGVASIREIDGVWTDVRHRVGGYDLTLDEIEHQILRPFFRDPRIHFAVNCASMSCAPLPPWAFDGARIDEQLASRQAGFLSDPRNVRVEDGHLLLSKYFDLYGSDFTTDGWHGAAESVAAWLRAQNSTPPEIKALLHATPSPPITYLEYDWSLNER